MGRRTQPYRKGAGTRQPGAVLRAMRRGRTLHGVNPADGKRALARSARRRKRSALTRAMYR
jgi:hypothetical protein